MKRYKCIVSYIGKNYDGFQSQSSHNSLQDVIEEAFTHISNENIKIVASGRTDAKVNAQGQVFHFDSAMDLSPYKWKGAINGYLPDDIHILDVQEVSDTFHARYCVRKKQYDYKIHLHEYDVFTKDMAYQCPYDLDIQKMKEASTHLLGTHDFTSLNSSSLEEYPDQTRTIERIDFHLEEDMLTISFLAKGFLRYMVRMMVGLLIEVGKGNLEIDAIDRILNEKSKRAFSKNAEPQGLTLKKVEYFDILSLNDDGMIREFIEGDRMIDGYTLDILDALPINKKIYAFTTRNTQELLGYLEIKDTCHLYVFKKDNISVAQSLLDGLKKWLIRNNIEANISICDLHDKIIEND